MVMLRYKYWKILLSVLLGCVILVFSPLIGLAESTDVSTEPNGFLIPNKTDDMPSSGTESYSVFSMMLKVVISLIIIIGLFLFLMKFLGQKNNRWLGNRTVRTLGGVSLGQNKSLQLVEVGQSIFVVGVGDNVQLLDKINDAEEIDYILDTLKQQSNQSKDLLSLSTWMKTMRREKIEHSDDEMVASFHQVFQHKMKSLTNRKKMVEDMFQDDKQTERSYDK